MNGLTVNLHLLMVRNAAGRRSEVSQQQVR